MMTYKPQVVLAIGADAVNRLQLTEHSKSTGR